MDFIAWSQIALVCMIGAMSPGPSLAVIIRNTMSGGRLQGVMASIGHGIGVGLYALAAVTGLALLIMAEPTISIFANWAGAGFLGIHVIRCLWHINQKSRISASMEG